MNKIKKEDGYALVTVLLIIVVFMILFLSFTGQSFNTVKQNQVVESKTKSTSIAEMGLTYYQVTIANIFLAKQAYYNHKIITDSNPSFTETDIINDIIGTIKLRLQNGLSPFPVDSTNSFKVENNYTVGTDPSNNKKITIEFSVTGNEKRTLKTEMNINLKDLIVNKTVTPPDYDKIEEITAGDVLPSCRNPDTFTDSSCRDGIFLNMDKTYNDKFQGYSKTIYSTANLTLTGNGQKSGLTVHAFNLTMSGNLNNMNDATYETENDLTLNGHSYGEGLNIYVNGNLIASDRFELYNSTTNPTKIYYTYVRGYASFTDKVQIQSNNIVCINGTVTANKKIDVYGKLYVRAGLPHVGLEDIPTDKISYITNADLNDESKLSDLQSKCGNTFDVPQKSIIWGENAKTLVDTINY